MKMATIKITDADEFFANFFRCVAKTFELDSVTHNGVTYYNGKSLWYTPEVGRDVLKCNGYEGCDCAHKRLRLPLNADVKYHLIFAPDDELFEEEEDAEVRRIYNAFKSSDPYRGIVSTDNDAALDTKYAFDKPLTIVNSCGVNDDHRGSDHTKIVLDFHEEINLPSTCSAIELIDTFFRLKSHKFENWYEMYCGCEVDDVGVKYIVSLDFDHGS
jgi:hypothetical protein